MLGGNVTGATGFPVSLAGEASAGYLMGRTLMLLATLLLAMLVGYLGVDVFQEFLKRKP